MPDQPLNLPSRNMVAALIQYFTIENENQAPILSYNAVVERVAAALNVSESTVKRIKKCVKKNESLERPQRCKPRWSPKSADLDKNVKSEIRNVIFNMYADKKVVTVKSLQKELATKNILTAHRTTIRKLMMNLDFKYKKGDSKRALVERTNVALTRIDFLRKYMKNKLSTCPRQLVFVGDTWIFAKKSHTQSWQDPSPKSVRKQEGYERKRFIVLHAGTKKGFVANADFVCSTKSKLAADEDMSSEIFWEWLQNKFIPNLEEPSLIIMDNAPYHTILLEKQPTFSWTKDQIKEWLNENQIEFNNYMFKVELLELAKKHMKPKRCMVDELLQKNGHEVLRLPPYHCQFNAIETIWKHAKDLLNKRIGEGGYGDNKVKSMWQQALEKCTPDVWKENIIHTEKFIDEWYKKEHLIEEIPEIIIHVSNDSDSDEEMSASEI